MTHWDDQWSRANDHRDETPAVLTLRCAFAFASCCAIQPLDPRLSPVLTDWAGTMSAPRLDVAHAVAAHVQVCAQRGGGEGEAAASRRVIGLPPLAHTDLARLSALRWNCDRAGGAESRAAQSARAAR